MVITQISVKSRFLVWDLDDGVGALWEVDNAACIQVGKWNLLDAQLGIDTSADLVGRILLKVAVGSCLPNGNAAFVMFMSVQNVL